MKKLAENICSRLHWLVFLIFTTMQAVIIDKIVLFGDDYYYCTFLYNGIGHFFSENAKHYLETNGRAIVHLLDELLLAGGTIIAWKIFAVITTALIALFCALIAAKVWKYGIKTEKFKLSLVLSCVCISFISISTASQTLYWATGFLNYVWPILLTLMLFYFTENSLYRGYFSPLICPLALFACSGTEQNAFACLCILVFAAIRIFAKKIKVGTAFWISLILGFIGFISLFAAPGNAVRTTYYAEFYSLPITQRILRNVLRLFSLIFRTSGAVNALILFFAAAACASYEKLKGLSSLLIMTLNALAAVLLCGQLKFGFCETPSIIFALLAFAIDALISVVYFIRAKETSFPFFIVMAAGMQAAMLISPEMGPRTIIVSVIFLIIPTAALAAESKKPLIYCLVLSLLMGLINNIGVLVTILMLVLITMTALCICLKKLNKYAIASGIILLALLMSDSLSAFIFGYSQNYVIHKENQALLEEYRQDLDNGGEHILKQKYLPNVIHKYTMPYDDPYHMYWFKIAKKLPTDTVIIYE